MTVEKRLTRKHVAFVSDDSIIWNAAHTSPVLYTGDLPVERVWVEFTEI